MYNISFEPAKETRVGHVIHVSTQNTTLSRVEESGFAISVYIRDVIRCV